MKLNPIMINHLNTATPHPSRHYKLSNTSTVATVNNPQQASEVKLRHSLNTKNAPPQQDIDETKIADIKLAMMSGKYSINPESIARGMLDDIGLSC